MGALPRSENRGRIILVIAIPTVIYDINNFFITFHKSWHLEEKFG